MRCISCNRILNHIERNSYKYYGDETSDDVIYRSMEIEDMCISCRVVAYSDYNILEDKEYQFNDLVDGASKPSGFSDNY